LLQCEARQFLPNFSFEMFEWLEIEGRKPGFMSRTLRRKKHQPTFFCGVSTPFDQIYFPIRKGAMKNTKHFVRHGLHVVHTLDECCVMIG
jgi:hypothetical protein